MPNNPISPDGDAEPTGSESGPNIDSGIRAVADGAGESEPVPASANNGGGGEKGSVSYEYYREHDPFPRILPALLNAADIRDYVEQTKMISPFDPERLKSASYEIGLGKFYATAPSPGEGSDWIFHEVEDHGLIVLPPNGLIYVALDTRLALPPYIAARFNLKITNVYRGLIAGTGPLVDPGFRNNLFIPLHNLSSVEYTFEPGEGLIWMEFTKLSTNESWVIEDPMLERVGVPVGFPDDKKARTELRQYLNKASKQPISSSVSQPLKEMERTVERLERRLRIFQIGGGLAALVGAATLITLVVATLTFVTDLNRDVNNYRREHTTTTTTDLPSTTTTLLVTTSAPPTTAGTSPP